MPRTPLFSPKMTQETKLVTREQNGLCLARSTFRLQARTHRALLLASGLPDATWLRIGYISLGSPFPSPGNYGNYQAVQSHALLGRLQVSWPWGRPITALIMIRLSFVILRPNLCTFQFLTAGNPIKAGMVLSTSHSTHDFGPSSICQPEGDLCHILARGKRRSRQTAKTVRLSACIAVTSSKPFLPSTCSQ